MPEKYEYQRMEGDEVVALMRAANLSVSDLTRLFGRHYIEIRAYMNPDDKRRPTVPEMFILIYLARHPQYVPVFKALADESILRQMKKGETA